MARDMNLKADFSGGAQFKGSLLSKLLRANDELNGARDEQWIEELDDSDLDMLAAAGAPTAPNSSGNPVM